MNLNTERAFAPLANGTRPAANRKAAAARRRRARRARRPAARAHQPAERKTAPAPRESLLRSARRCAMLPVSSSLQQEEHTMLAPILVTAYAALVLGCALTVTRAIMRTGRR